MTVFATLWTAALSADLSGWPGPMPAATGAGTLFVYAGIMFLTGHVVGVVGRALLWRAGRGA
jgi:hypothetical protein